MPRVVEHNVIGSSDHAGMIGVFDPDSDSRKGDRGVPANPVLDRPKFMMSGTMVFPYCQIRPDKDDFLRCQDVLPYCPWIRVKLDVGDLTSGLSNLAGIVSQNTEENDENTKSDQVRKFLIGTVQSEPVGRHARRTNQKRHPTTGIAG